MKLINTQMVSLVKYWIIVSVKKPHMFTLNGQLYTNGRYGGIAFTTSMVSSVAMMPFKKGSKYCLTGVA